MSTVFTIRASTWSNWLTIVIRLLPFTKIDNELRNQINIPIPNLLKARLEKKSTMLLSHRHCINTFHFNRIIQCEFWRLFFRIQKRRLKKNRLTATDKFETSYHLIVSKEWTVNLIYIMKMVLSNFQRNSH